MECSPALVPESKYKQAHFYERKARSDAALVERTEESTGLVIM